MKQTFGRSDTAQSRRIFTKSAVFFIERKFSAKIISAGLQRESSLMTSASMSLSSKKLTAASPVEMSAEATPQVLFTSS